MEQLWSIYSHEITWEYFLHTIGITEASKSIPFL